MELTYDQKKHIYEHGYVVIPGAIPQYMVDKALTAINSSVGQGMDKSDMRQFSAQSFCPELTTQPIITDMFNETPAWRLTESLLGKGNIREKAGYGQIGLRFPHMSDRVLKSSPHVDGMYTPYNGVPEGTIENFTLLASILLSDLPNPNAGNFTVWPGTHRLYEQYFREHGAEALLSGMPPVELPEPIQITGRPGDLVLCHYQLAHGVTPNVSPHIRYALFFRIYHTEHNVTSSWQAPMQNIWMHWEGMSEFK